MLKFIQNNREITALLAVVLLFVLPGFLDRQYLSVQTLTMVYSSAQILILLAMGATLVMLTRNIDVSVGSITGMCAVLLGMLLNAGYSLPVACVATLLLGLLAGFSTVSGRVAKDPCHCCHPWHVRVVQRHHVAVDWRQMD